MKKLFPFLLIVLAVESSFFISSCCGKKKTTAQTTTTPEVKRDFAAEGYIKATVIFYEIDACKYIIRLESDPNGPDVLKQLEPTNLSVEFQKDQLPVWIKYTAKKGAVSPCMAGQVVELSDIQLRN